MASLPDEHAQASLTSEYRQEAGDWLFVVYSWETERGSRERVRREIATFLSVGQAAKAFPRGILRAPFCSKGNPVRMGAYCCPRCGGCYYTLAWNIPLVYRCA